MKQKYENKQSFMNAANAVISLYLFIMLGLFPVYYKYQYADMGDKKYGIFLYSSVICVVIFFFLFIVNSIFGSNRFQKESLISAIKDESKKMKLDAAVFIYFICTTVSFLTGSFKETGFWGADGWNMGYLSQILFVAVYFLISRKWDYQKWAIWLLMTSSAIVFLAAVFHRFDIDILNIYGDLELYYKVLFLSTMGQSSWYSSFLCTVFPVGLYLFFISENKKVRQVSGGYSVIAMCSLVTQNTDSAFLSLTGVVMVLLYLSFDEKNTGSNYENGYFPHKRFLETVMLVLGSFCFMGICRRIFSNRAIPLDTLSLYMSQSAVTWILLIAAVVCYIYFMYKNNRDMQQTNRCREKKEGETDRLFFWILLGGIGVGILAATVFIFLNTNGFLLEKFGYQSLNNYLLFDDQWGTGRGFGWKFTVASFAEFPLFRKIVGVGPDCFSAYIASVPQYQEQMSRFWGDLVLTNAHNEYLTKLYNVGILGLIAYVGMLVTAVWTFLKYRKENPFLPAFALCVVSYMVHNIFCYEQVCCSPIFYILMGIGSNLVHNKIQKGTY